MLFGPHRRRHHHHDLAGSSYRGTTDEDLEREKKSEGKIKTALAQAKRAMKFGDSYGAVSALEEVKQVLLLPLLPLPLLLFLRMKRKFGRVSRFL